MNKCFILCLIVCCIALEPIRGINPVEGVSFGGAVQAGEDTHELDVNENMGIERVGGVMSKLLSKNNPNKRPQILSTASDNHRVTIQVSEGEIPMTKDNHSLGKSVLRSNRSTADERGTGNKEKITTTNDEDIELTLTETFVLKDKKVKNKVKRIKWRHKTHRHFRKPLII